ncbi:D-sedoheptulose 7-phosphate isomerase [Oxalobacter aliiformigenes]|uniref:D-sedoheptulose-7-phosphate isomerase n=1 Tax=Oxalobacter aliiformigenes TaxID=2946593 RepID=UPI0022B04D4C|nr:D-sedoheptulose 7-phosphate isomerase [Oxalobacter aliiformigenes]WAV88731.1 D-sedoheptulose 7-phosphate isomerase [Oxalobacter aliiformigenes]
MKNFFSAKKQYELKMKEIEIALDQIAYNFINLKNKALIINDISKVWINALSNGNKVIFCGNGGSAADSQHLAAELMGRYKIDRNPMASISLTVDTSALTAIGNDYGYEKVFSRQLRGIGKTGDVLVGISTSGNSKNILDAFQTAKELGIKTVAFTGEGGGAMKKEADLCLNVPSTVTNNIQEMHIACGHMICGIVENHFYGK